MTRRRERLWKVTVGGHGYTVMACERKKGGSLYLRWWDPTRKPKGNFVWRSLRHHDQTRAEEQARALAGQLLAAVDTARAGRVTVAELLGRYEREVTPHKKGDQPAEDARRIALWQTFLGATRDVRTIDFPTLDRFVRERRAGTIEVKRLNDTGELEPIAFAAKPSDTTIGADLIFLNAVLNWGTRVMLPDGSRLVEQNPIRGYERPRNKNPKRPVATYDRYLAVRETADAADPQGLFGSFLDLVEALGWRVTALCELWASDVDRKASPAAPHGRLRKRGEVDKEGVTMWVPLSEPARQAIDRVLEINPTVGDVPLFPMPAHRAAPWTRYHARAILHRAEKAAGLAPLDGGDFHPYRRAWATARKHLPARDVAAAGGWRDLRSLERCYQQVDDSTLLAVVTEPKKLREVKSQA